MKTLPTSVFEDNQTVIEKKVNKFNDKIHAARKPFLKQMAAKKQDLIKTQKAFNAVKTIEQQRDAYIEMINYAGHFTSDGQPITDEVLQEKQRILKEQEEPLTMVYPNTEKGEMPEVCVDGVCEIPTEETTDER